MGISNLFVFASLMLKDDSPFSLAYMFQMGTLPETNIALENPQFWWYLPGNLGIFYGYVSLTEGSFSKQTTRERVDVTLCHSPDQPDQPDWYPVCKPTSAPKGRQKLDGFFPIWLTYLGCADRDEQMSNGWPFSLLNDEQRVATRWGCFAPTRYFCQNCGRKNLSVSKKKVNTTFGGVGLFVVFCRYLRLFL